MLECFLLHLEGVARAFKLRTFKHFQCFSDVNQGRSEVIEAIRFRLLCPDVLQHGWVLDDFPCTKPQAASKLLF